MPQHSTRAASPLPSNSLWGRLPQRSWPVRLVLVAALLLAVPFLFHAGSTVHAADNEITGVTLTSPSPGELVITWDAPSRAPDDYRVTWKKSDGKWPSYKNDNTVEGGNAFPTVTSHTVTGLEEGTEYSVRVRARYHDSEDNVEESGPWSTAKDITVAQTQLPAKPTGLLPGRSHNTVLLFWTDPGDDSITGYQVLRGDDADNLAVLTADTGSTSASYTDDTVEAETTYAYAIKARNAGGLSPQSDPITVRTLAAPAEPESDLAVAGVDFIIAGQMMDTTGTCSQDDIDQIGDACTHDITNPMPQFGVVGTLDGDDEVTVGIGRDLANVADQSDLQGANKRITPTFQPGRNLLYILGDEDGTGSDAPEQHFFRVNVVPYWEWNGERLSKDSDCRDTTANAPTVDEITDDDCIVAPQFGNTAELRFFNVTEEHFNVYVEVNETNVINEPSTTDLGSAFTVNLDAGDNLIRIRLAAKGSQPLAETYDSDSFYYKVTGTDVLVSNLGQTDRIANPRISSGTPRAQQFTTGSNPSGYKISEVVVDYRTFASGTLDFSIHQTDDSGTFDVPGNRVVDLTGTPTTTGEFSFTPSNTTTLDPSTKYFVVFRKTDGDFIVVQPTDSDDVDPGGADGWDLADGSIDFFSSTWSEGTFSLKIAIKGALATVSTDATLSGLALTDPDNNAITLDPTFASGVESYTATVTYAVSQIKVEPTKNDDTASVRYLDSTDNVLTDADTNTGVFDVDLRLGENIVKVKVTASDGMTTKTYQVTVTRVDFLASNLGKSRVEDYTITSTNTAAAVQIGFIVQMERGKRGGSPLSRCQDGCRGDFRAASQRRPVKRTHKWVRHVVPDERFGSSQVGLS